MMNILFILHGQCCPTVGGIERVTDILVNEFSRLYGYNSYYLFQEEKYNLEETKFCNSHYLPNPSREAIADIINECLIDIIINQEEHFISEIIYEAVKMSGRNCKIVYCLHSAPLAIPRESVSFTKIIRKWGKNNSFSDILKILVYPLYRYWNLEKAKDLCRRAYNYSDYNVLLSNAYTSEWRDIVCSKNNNRETEILIIPNPSTFNHFITDKDISNKKKRVLIVSRLYHLKNIKEALKIWKEIEKDKRFADWRLDIVGDGPEREMLENYAANNLNQVVFHGRQNPIKYYMEASIFMMTSRTEGWGMTLVEALQLGCIPICYNTFEAVTDLFPESNNGSIIKAWDRSAYVTRLKELMLDNEGRKNLVKEGVDYTRRFSADNICKRWCDLFEK